MAFHLLAIDLIILSCPLTILITGGTGYIGSHTAVELLQQGHNVLLADNLSNSKRITVERIRKITRKPVDFYEIDCSNRMQLAELFQKRKIDVVIHMAGLKAVADSVAHPLTYYDNNLASTIAILKEMARYNITNFIFSSSATVYGDSVGAGCSETLQTGRGITNPYGKTKYMIEEIVKDYAQSNKHFSAVLLRYFNPVGAHPSGLLGEDPTMPPTNLMPVLVRVFQGLQKELEIYGNNYSTPDGSCIRDYIHVVDLAKGHVAALAGLRPGVSIFNLGTGKGTSVIELIALFERISGTTLPTRIVGRRAGDLPIVYADSRRANQELDWKAKLTIEDAIRDTLTYIYSNHPRDNDL